MRTSTHFAKLLQLNTLASQVNVNYEERVFLTYKSGRLMLRKDKSRVSR